jgi:hypothetical protein
VTLARIFAAPRDDVDRFARYEFVYSAKFPDNVRCAARTETAE